MSKQIGLWKGDFGREYTNRNIEVSPLSVDAIKVEIEALENDHLKKYGINRLSLNNIFLEGIDRSIRILEVGVNVGIQLNNLKLLGFKKLYGVEPQINAVQILKKYNKTIKCVVGTGVELPFKDNFFDLVYTSGVLIHISPEDIPLVMREIHRCTKRWIWGFEYYSRSIEEIEYRGRRGLLWKADYANLYLKYCPDLKIVKRQRLKYIEEPNLEDEMFLLEKTK